MRLPPFLTPAPRRAHNRPLPLRDQTPRSFPAAAGQFAGRSRPHDLAGAHAVHAEPLRSLRVERELPAPERGDGEVLHSGRRAASGGADGLRPLHSEASDAQLEEELAPASQGGEIAEIRSHYAARVAAMRGALTGIDATAMIRRLRDEETAVVRSARDRHPQRRASQLTPQGVSTKMATPARQQLG